VKPDFTVNPAWREALYQKLVADTVKIDKAVWDGGAPDIDRAIEDRVAKVAFGDTLVRRRSLKDDNQLRAAIDLLKKAATQKDVFTAAGSAPAVTKPGVARRGGK
jgi:carboxyl-terminal processing protease